MNARGVSFVLVLALGCACSSRSHDDAFVAPFPPPLSRAGGTSSYEAAFVSSGERFAATIMGKTLTVSKTGTLAFDAVDHPNIDIRTREVVTGGETVVPNGEFSITTSKVLERACGSFVEHLTLKEGLVEQSWTLTEKPKSAGNITVKVAVSPSARLARVSGGVALGSFGTYGAATWIGADGTRTIVPMTVAGQEIAITVPSSLVEQTAFPAILDPTITPATGDDGHPVDGQVVMVGRNPVGDAPALAFDGSNYVTANLDISSKNGSSYSSPAVVVRRISETGSMLETAGVRISEGVEPVDMGLFGQYQGGATASLVRIASSSAGTLVTWVESNYIDEPSLRAVRLTPSGTVVDTPPLRIVAPALEYRNETGTLASIAWPHMVAADANGFRIMAAVPHPGGGLDIKVYRVAAPTSTAPAVENGVTIAEGALAARIATSQYGVQWFGDTANAMLAWTQADVDEAGVWSSSVRVVALPAPGASPKIAKTIPNVSSVDLGFSKSNVPYLVARPNWVPGPTPAPRLVRLTFEGDVVSNVPLGDDGYELWPPVFDGTNIIATRPNVCVQQFDLNGVNVGTCTAIPPDPARPPGYDTFAVTTRVGVGASTYLEAKSNRFMALVRKGDLEPVAHTNLDPIGNGQTRPRVASNGTDSVVVWKDERHADTSPEQGGGTAIYAALVHPDGTADAAIRLSEHAVTDNSDPRIVFDGSKYFVVWNEWDPSTYFDTYYRDAAANIASAVLSGSGPLTVEKRIRVAMQATKTRVSVTSDGANRIVAFQRSLGGSSSKEEFGPMVVVRVAIADDSVLDSTPVVVAPAALLYREPPIIASNRLGSLITWFEGDPITVSLSLRAVLLPKGTTTPGPVHTVGTKIVKALNRLDIASDGERFMLAWSELVSDAGSFAVRGQLLTPEGENFGSPIAVGSGGVAPAVAYAGDGSNFLVTWSDRRNPLEQEIYGSWVDRFSGKVKDPEGVPIATLQRAHELYPSAAAVANGVGIVAYERLDRTPSVNNFRVVTRAFRSGKLSGEACEDSGPCASRYCVDGVCCVEPCNEGCGVCNAIPGTCTPKSSETSCGQIQSFHCDGVKTSCPIACASNAECAPGYSCVANYCEPRAAECASDFEAFDANGSPVSCGDLRCRFGSCLSRCATVDDCRAGLVCTFDGECRPAVPPVAEPGCTTSDSRPLGSLSAVAAASLLLIALRRRRVTSRSSR